MESEIKNKYGKLDSTTNQSVSYSYDLKYGQNRLFSLKNHLFNFKNFEYSYKIDGNFDGPAIFTLHDIGQNASIAFGPFFSLSITKSILKEFCVYYITLPGQDENDAYLQSYPNFDEIAEAVCELIKLANKKLCIGFGIGAGANLLVRVHLRDKSIFSRLILVNGFVGQMSWYEWLTQKYYTYDSSEVSVPENTKSYLQYHFFGDVFTNDFCFYFYSQFLDSLKNAGNLKHFLDSFAQRFPIKVQKADFPIMSLNEADIPQNAISCPVLLVISEDMPYSEDYYSFKDSIDPHLIESIEFKNAHGFVLDQFPIKVTQAIIYFLQGLGYLRGVEAPNEIDFSYPKMLSATLT